MSKALIAATRGTRVGRERERAAVEARSWMLVSCLKAGEAACEKGRARTAFSCCS